MVRLKCNCRDDGFVVAGLRGLLDGRKQWDIKNNDGGLRTTRLSNKRHDGWRMPLQFKSMIRHGNFINKLTVFYESHVQ